MAIIFPMPPKLPDEVLDYAADFSDRLDVGEAVSSYVVAVTRGSVTVSNITQAGGIVTFYLAGGVALESCLVKVEVVTNHTPPRTHEVLLSVAIASPGP